MGNEKQKIIFKPEKSTQEKKSDFRLLMSPLTKTIFAGRVKLRDGYAESVGVRHDVTSDFLACIIQYAESYDGEFAIYENGAPAYEVVVRRIEGIKESQ